MTNPVETAIEIRPFRIDIPQEELADLRRRIAATRWPERETVADGSQGVQLTTMQQPCREIAVAAFQALRERISDPALPPRSIFLTPRLIVRESCGAYRR